MWKYPGVVVAAILLGTAPPIVAEFDLGLLLRTWLQWLPLELHLMFLPDTEMMMAVLAMLVIAVLHLLIFLLVWPVQPDFRRMWKALVKPLQRPGSKSKYLPRPTGH